MQITAGQPINALRTGIQLSSWNAPTITLNGHVIINGRLSQRSYVVPMLGQITVTNNVNASGKSLTTYGGVQTGTGDTGAPNK